MFGRAVQKRGSRTHAPAAGSFSTTRWGSCAVRGRLKTCVREVLKSPSGSECCRESSINSSQTVPGTHDSLTKKANVAPAGLYVGYFFHIVRVKKKKKCNVHCGNTDFTHLEWGCRGKAWCFTLKPSFLSSKETAEQMWLVRFLQPPRSSQDAFFSLWSSQGGASYRHKAMA